MYMLCPELTISHNSDVPIISRADAPVLSSARSLFGADLFHSSACHSIENYLTRSRRLPKLAKATPVHMIKRFSIHAQLQLLIFPFYIPASSHFINSHSAAPTRLSAVRLYILVLSRWIIPYWLAGLSFLTETLRSSYRPPEPTDSIRLCCVAAHHSSDMSSIDFRRLN